MGGLGAGKIDSEKNQTRLFTDDRITKGRERVQTGAGEVDERDLREAELERREQQQKKKEDM